MAKNPETFARFSVKKIITNISWWAWACSARRPFARTLAGTGWSRPADPVWPNQSPGSGISKDSYSFGAPRNWKRRTLELDVPGDLARHHRLGYAHGAGKLPMLWWDICRFIRIAGQPDRILVGLRIPGAVQPDVYHAVGHHPDPGFKPCHEGQDPGLGTRFITKVRGITGGVMAMIGLVILIWVL